MSTLELIEAAAGLHTLAIKLENEGHIYHAQVLKTTIEMEIKELLPMNFNRESNHLEK